MRDGRGGQRDPWREWGGRDCPFQTISRDHWGTRLLGVDRQLAYINI